MVHYYDGRRTTEGPVCTSLTRSASRACRDIDGFTVTELPVIDVASVIHRGGMENIRFVYEALFRWIENSGFMAGYSREPYREMGPGRPRITEIQVPILK